MRLKSGVRLDGLQWPLWYAAAVADYLHQAQGWGQATITSGLDGGDAFGPARVTTSGHPFGNAIDIRSRDMPAEMRQAYAQGLQSMLGNFFRVVLEVDHFHVEVAQPITV